MTLTDQAKKIAALAARLLQSPGAAILPADLRAVVGELCLFNVDLARRVETLEKDQRECQR